MIGENNMQFDFSKLTLGGGFLGSSKAFQCPNCSGFASHLLECYPLDINRTYSKFLRFTIIAQCQACDNFSIWLTNNLPVTKVETTNLKGLDTTYASVTLIFPSTSSDSSEVPALNSDMPDNVKEIYKEAGDVLNVSPRASAALSRLAIENLVEYLGAEGKDLNNKIGNLVSKGMPIEIQQMLDSVRVIGNNAVHPGQINIKDNKELALSLLHFVNLITDNQISQPKKIAEIYDSLPESYKKSIEKKIVNLHRLDPIQKLNGFHSSSIE